MRNTILVLCFIANIAINSFVYASSIRPEYLIRRAYLDVVGVVPTTEEIDWYCVYNTKESYSLAIKHLLSLPNKIWEEENMEEILLSNEYKNQQPRKIDINSSIFYIAGMIPPANYTNLDLAVAKQKVIKNALKEGMSLEDTADLLCNQFMSRCTNAKEANILNTKLKKIQQYALSEENVLLQLFEEILLFPDVCHK